MVLFVVTVISIYFVLHIVLYIGLKRSANLKQGSSDRIPFISVIVAARNEEDNIFKCIKSLKNIDYPKNCYEIFLVNDNSTDSTLSIMNKETNEFDEFIVLDTKDYNSHSNLNGKVKALAYAISLSKGELFMMTDADCQVPATWLSETAKYFDNNTGLICGFTKIDFHSALFSKLQSLDWLYLQSLASASSGIHYELSCIGNNLSITKNSYVSIGGYENLKFSVTEDLALMRKIKKLKAGTIKYPIKPECLILTQECNNLTELFRQKKRWFRGGLGINWLGYLLGFILYLSNLFFVSGFLFLDIKTYLFLLSVKVISELILIIPVYKIFNYKGLLIYYPLFQIYFALYGLLLPFTFVTGKKITWKGRNH